MQERAGCTPAAPLSRHDPHFTAIVMFQGNPMKRFMLAITAVVLAVSLDSTVQAATGPARTRLDAFATGLHSLTGHFTQSLTDINGKVSKTSSGT
ncbi:MAG TPA: hypothetical protein VGG00_02465, partial [Rhodanobacter sp.]